MSQQNAPEVILVDTHDRPIGTAEKMEAHLTPKLHRAFSVFLYHDNQMLIQLRADHKYHSGGKWSNGCCSHPRPHEELATAVPNRMVEELGFSCEVEEIFQFTYFAQFEENLYEYEYDHVFIGEYRGEYILNPEEAQDAKWVDLDALEQDVVRNPTKYSVWFLISIQRVIDEIRKRTL